MTTVTEVKERGIIFSGEMVRAILDGRKTQTRRVVKWKMWPGMPVESVEAHHIPFTDSPANECSWTADHAEGGAIYVEQDIRCPYGLVGDRLWVRETWGEDYVGSSLESTGSQGQLLCGPKAEVVYRADGHTMSDVSTGWKSPIHMFRWASRLALEITDVRVQRLHEISARACLDEGVTIREGEGGLVTRAFRRTWDTLNAKRGYSWESDPWVWAITFKRATTRR